MAQPLDIIKGAFRSAGILAEGESSSSDSTNDAFEMLNDMLDQWSNQRMMIYAVDEVIHELTASKYVYTIGPGGDVGAAFTASIAGTIMTVTALTSGALSVGQTITGAAAGTTISAMGTGLGGNGTGAIGTYSVNVSQTLASTSLTSSAVRPLRVNSAFVRVPSSGGNNLDFPVMVLNVEAYELIGIKALNGAWPKALYYQPTMPLGVLSYWPSPSSGEMHLFCDHVLGQFQTINDTIQLPQGYKMALRWNLCELICPEFGKSVTPEIAKNAAEGRAFIKRTNMAPPPVANYDPALLFARQKDAAWIYSGGFQ